MSISDRLYEDNFSKTEQREKIHKEKLDKDAANPYRPSVSQYNT